jgi:hypothetical protein
MSLPAVDHGLHGGDRLDPPVQRFDRDAQAGGE